MWKNILAKCNGFSVDGYNLCIFCIESTFVSKRHIRWIELVIVVVIFWD